MWGIVQRVLNYLNHFDLMLYSRGGRIKKSWLIILSQTSWKEEKPWLQTEHQFNQDMECPEIKTVKRKIQVQMIHSHYLCFSQIKQHQIKETNTLTEHNEFKAGELAMEKSLHKWAVLTQQLLTQLLDNLWLDLHTQMMLKWSPCAAAPKADPQPGVAQPSVQGASSHLLLLPCEDSCWLHGSPLGAPGI